MVSCQRSEVRGDLNGTVKLAFTKPEESQPESGETSCQLSVVSRRSRESIRLRAFSDLLRHGGTRRPESSAKPKRARIHNGFQHRSDRRGADRNTQGRACSPKWSRLSGLVCAEASELDFTVSEKS